MTDAPAESPIIKHYTERGYVEVTASMSKVYADHGCTVIRSSPPCDPHFHARYWVSKDEYELMQRMFTLRANLRSFI